jgi:hypothetical protein
LLELFQMFVDLVPRGGALARCADEKRTLDRRRESDQIAGNGNDSR